MTFAVRIGSSTNSLKWQPESPSNDASGKLLFRSETCNTALSRVVILDDSPA
jgi:hypothetical protein